MSSRARYRVGRQVQYNPTATEVTSFGAGPYPARIVRVNANNTVDLDVSVPAAVTAEITEAGTADGTYGATPEAALINQSAALATELRDREGLRFKSGVAEGSTGGTFSFTAGPTAV